MFICFKDNKFNFSIFNHDAIYSYGFVQHHLKLWQELIDLFFSYYIIFKDLIVIFFFVH
jgi:hypothetical protein